MYSCYDGYLVFGVMEYGRDAMLDHEWLQENFPSIEVYASDVVRNHMGSAVYGIQLQLDEQTGEVYICKEVRAEVSRLHQMLCAYYTNLGETDMPTIGFYTVVSGDYEYSQHNEYIPE